MSTLRTLPPNARFDLHLHSHLSDGKVAPAELLDLCGRGGLDVIALTDHDLPPALSAGRHLVGQRVVTVLHGVELSGVHEGKELHLLVYFPGEMPADFRVFLAGRARARADRYDEAVRRLDLEGLEVAPPAARNGERSITRFHLSQALVASGHAHNLNDAFRRFTGSEHGNVPPVTLGWLEAIASARAAGGVTSWAHPDVDDAERWTAAFAAGGLQGLEALRPANKRQQRNALRRLAREHGLFVTGGSDWHGWWNDRPGRFAAPLRELQGFAEALAAA